MDKKDLLKLLTKDSELRQLIRNIVAEPSDSEATASKTEPAHASQAHISQQAEKIDALIEQNKQLTEDNMDLNKVIEKFKTLFSNEEQTSQALRETRTVLEQRLSTLEQDLESLKHAKQQSEQQLTHCQSDLAHYQQQFQADVTHYELFNGLSASTQRSIAGIFKDSSLPGFIACGVQDRNIDSFWQYIKTQVIEANNPDSDVLIRLFDFLFSRYTYAYPHIKKQTVAIGERFDPVKHIKTPNSATSGTIQAIILSGWENTNNDKLIRPTLVRL